MWHCKFCYADDLEDKMRKHVPMTARVQVIPLMEGEHGERVLLVWQGLDLADRQPFLVTNGGSNGDRD